MGRGSLGNTLCWLQAHGGNANALVAAPPAAAENTTIAIASCIANRKPLTLTMRRPVLALAFRSGQMENLRPSVRLPLPCSGPGMM